jgi:hypothetical protein
VLESLLITDLRVQFKVKKTLKKEPNSATSVVSNLQRTAGPRCRKSA